MKHIIVLISSNRLNRIYQTIYNQQITLKRAVAAHVHLDEKLYTV